MQLDALDQIAAKAFDGYIVRKDLVRKFERQYPVPTYVAEFLLGRYCASIDETKSRKDCDRRTAVGDRTVRAARKNCSRPAPRPGLGQAHRPHHRPADAKTDCYRRELPSLQLNDVRIADELVREHERMLTGGFYAEIDLDYDAAHRPGEKRPALRHRSLRPIQLSKRDVLETCIAVGRALTFNGEWKDFLLRSVGLEPDQL